MPDCIYSLEKKVLYIYIQIPQNLHHPNDYANKAACKQVNNFQFLDSKKSTEKDRNIILCNKLILIKWVISRNFCSKFLVISVSERSGWQHCFMCWRANNIRIHSSLASHHCEINDFITGGNHETVLSKYLCDRRSVR